MRVTSCRYQALFVLVVVLLACGQLFGGVTASISGTVTDPSGAGVSGATVTATNTDTGLVQTQRTNTQGFYSIQSLTLRHYDVSVQQVSLKQYRQTFLGRDVSAA